MTAAEIVAWSMILDAEGWATGGTGSGRVAWARMLLLQALDCGDVPWSKIDTALAALGLCSVDS